MTTLQCTKCEKTFKKWFVKNYAHVGIQGGGAGLAYTLVVWPFALRVYTKCPYCGEVTWMRVLKPKIFSGKEKLKLKNNFKNNNKLDRNKNE